MKNELKKQISKLRKLKNQMQKGSKERIELHRKIKAMKTELVEKQTITDEKQKIIDELIKSEPTFSVVDLTQYSIEQLKKSLEIRKRKQCGK
jgi:hypothetical protein